MIFYNFFMNSNICSLRCLRETLVLLQIGKLALQIVKDEIYDNNSTKSFYFILKI